VEKIKRHAWLGYEKDWVANVKGKSEARMRWTVETVKLERRIMDQV
jgi:hypothetical protein